MRKVFVFAWLLLPVAAGAYHYGPGQERLAADHAAESASRGAELARKAADLQAFQGEEAARELWAEAEAAFGEALDELPATRVHEARALRLERDKARMMISELPDARADLETLVDELSDDPDADAAQLADARGALASAQYYTTWLMRLEGLPREEWEPEIEASRQNYKLLAERADEADDAETAAQARKDLESSIRLARMDLDELQGLPLPSQ